MMMKVRGSLILGVVVLALGIVGLFSGETQLAQAMNTDFLLDVTRLVLGVVLIWGGLKSVEASHTALSIFGIAYLAMFVLGIASSNLFGLLPHGLGWLDQTLHIGGGLLAFVLAMGKLQRHAIA